MFAFLWFIAVQFVELGSESFERTVGKVKFRRKALSIYFSSL